MRMLNQVQHDVVNKSGEVRNIWFLWQQSFAGGCPLARANAQAFARAVG